MPNLAALMGLHIAAVCIKLMMTHWTMLVLNLLIIYFTCGAPFAVFALADPARGRRVRTTFALVTLVGWPLMVARQTHLLRVPGTGFRVGEVISELESRFGASASVRALCEFREVVSRYAALAGAVTVRGIPASSAVAELAQHPSREIASICLERARQRRIALHLASARNEVVSFLEMSDISTVNAGLNLGTILEDAELVRALLTLKASRASHSLSAAAA